MNFLPGPSLSQHVMMCTDNVVYFRSVSPVDTSVPVYTPGHRSQDITRVKLGGNSVSSSGLPLRTSIPSLSSSSTCSKESSNTSPSTSSRSSSDSGGSRIPISKSQDDLLRNVQLRNKRPGQANVGGGTKLQRPISYRNTRTSSPRNSKLMSRNSVEVLAYTESQKNNYNLNETSQRKYYSQYSNKPNKYEAASKFTKKFGSKDSSLNIYQKNSKKTLAADSKLSPTTQSNSSLIPTPASQKNNKNAEKKPTQPSAKPAASSLSSTARAGSSSNVGHNKLSAENKKNTRTCNNSTKSKAANKEKPVETKTPSDSLKIDDHVKTVDAKTEVSAGPPSEQRLTPMINSGGLQDKDPVKNVPTDRHSADSVEKLLSDQLMNGKLPPKAKFRADDEISIGDESCDALENCQEAENVKDEGSSMTQPRKVPVTPSKYDKMTKSKDAKCPDPYPPSAASLLVARCLEEGGGRMRDQKTASLPLNSALVSFDQPDKSTSLDKYYKADNKPQIVKTSSEGFFQRLSNLRRSFNSHDQKRTNVKIRPHITDSNTPFFQGISHPSKRQGNNISTGRSTRGHSHSIHLVLPPILQSYKTPTRKYLFQRAFPVTTTKVDKKLKRSFSFSDAHVIAQCVVDNDVGVIGDLFPAFLTSDSIYNAIDRDKLNKTESSAKDNAKVKKLTKIAKVKDTNSSEQTLIGASVRDDHEDDKNDASEASKLLDGSNLTLTASIVNINNVTGKT